MDLIINPEQQADAQKSQGDRNVGETGKNERTSTPADVRSGQHSLDHILIRSVGRHRHESRPNEPGENRVFDSKHSLDAIPAALGRVQTGGDEIGKMKSAVELGDFLQAARDCEIEEAESGQGASNHDRSLDEISPNDRLDSAKRRIN